MVIGIAQLITGSSDSSKDLVSNGGASFGDVGFNAIEIIDQCNKVRGREERESDAIAGHQHEVSALAEDATPVLLHEVDYEIAEDSSTSIAVGKLKEKRSSC